MTTSAHDARKNPFIAHGKKAHLSCGLKDAAPGAVIARSEATKQSRAGAVDEWAGAAGAAFAVRDEGHFICVIRPLVIIYNPLTKFVPPIDNSAE
jgi:hypothetical protein